MVISTFSNNLDYFQVGFFKEYEFSEEDDTDTIKIIDVFGDEIRWHNADAWTNYQDKWFCKIESRFRSRLSIFQNIEINGKLNILGHNA